MTPIPPGTHLVVFGTATTGIEARRAGFQIRDTFLIQGVSSTRLAFLLRKPLEESTLVQQVLKTGTGAINIDGCRVAPTGEKLVGGGGLSLGSGWSRPWMQDPDQVAAHTKRIKANEVQATEMGRWPPNLLFVHGPGCRRIGSTKIKGDKRPFIWARNSKGGFLNKTSEPRAKPHPGYADEDGNETVEEWSCEDSCSVAILDVQSGTLKSGAFNQARRKAGNGVFNDTFHGYSDPKQYQASEGGASRFFQQFANDVELIEWFTRLIAPHGSVLLTLSF